ncbi:hypothetical protein MMC25_008017 [Agyrium rufum]|nr:hypothetical protein [Agyrium rufum]
MSRPYQAYPGQQQHQPPYPGASSQPPYPQQPHSPYPQQPHSPYPPQPQSPYPPQPQGYSRPVPPPPPGGQSYGGYPQQGNAPPQNYPSRSQQQGGYQPASPGYPPPAGSYGQPPPAQYPPRPGYPPSSASGYPVSSTPGYGQPPQGQYGGAPPQGGQYPPQGQQGYPPQQQGGYPPQGQQYGQQPAQQQYGAPQGNPAQAGLYKQLLQATIQEKHLQNIINPNDPRLDQWAQKATTQVDQLCQKWKVPREVGQDIVKLALYDIVLYVDNSGSMQFEENGDRITDLKLILSRVAYAAALFDDDGIQVRFMNWNAGGAETRMLDGIRGEQQVDDLVSRVPFKGLTPIGTELRNKVIDPIIIARAHSGQLKKPVLVITVTDGQPAGEPQNSLADHIRYCSSELQRLPCGRGAAAFQFAQVGNDQAARAFLGKLDQEPGIGDVIDCTSNFENEQEEMMKSVPPVDLTPDLWLIKLMLGAIDSSYDTQDEQSSRPSGGPGGYGGPPHGGQYPPQGGQYPPQQQQQQGGYGGGGAYPGQQPQYGGQQQQQGGQYGRPPPPPGGQYPSQQGGQQYGGPPPPRY